MVVVVAPAVAAPALGFAIGLGVALAQLAWLARYSGETAWSLATRFTLARGVLVTSVAPWLAVDAPTGLARAWPCCAYAACFILDGLDGAIARRRGETSELGAALDVTTDALGVLIASGVAVRWGALPPWYLLLGGLYYLERFVERTTRARRVAARLFKRPSVRLMAGAQMLLVSVALLPAVQPGAFDVVASVVMLPTCAVFAHDIAARLGLVTRWVVR